ncbi:M16 family metallopeptidase [Pseudomonas muyukensis]|uniref:Insulinase family protein n=1 Tax=Pseudomonas muyukensis TaxID=2842357 RepID=A0ABX8MDG0_9PSED|nr:pitrilysin family protein [Pseudomonas muyukensis]QXH36085.1 insulinase family protein [Pseudomonas muyukensis]
MHDATRSEPTQAGAGLIPEQFSSTHGLDLNQTEQLSKHVQHWHTETGTAVRFVPSHELALVDLVLDFKAGRTQDGDTPGLAALTLYTLDEGTQAMDAQQFNERLDSLGVNVEKRLRAEYASVSLRSLADREVLAPAVDLLIAMVAQPALSDAAVERIRRQVSTAQAGQDASPRPRIRHETFQHLFKGHPYAHAMGATQAGLEAVTGDAVRTFHKRAYSATNLQISLVGDLSRPQAEALAERICRALPQGWAAVDAEPLPAPEAEIIHVEQAGISNTVLLALPLPLLPDAPGYPALVLANQVLGVGLESRLMQVLRQQRGLTYDVRSTLVPLQAGGILAIEWEIDARYNDASQTLVTDVLRQFIVDGPTQSELVLARQQLAGQRLREVARNQSLAQLLAQMGRQGLADDHLSTYVDNLTRLTAQEVRHALRHLDLEAIVAVSTGPSQDQAPLPPLPTADQ